MSKILILEEILVGFCGQFGGREMRVGIFVSAYKCREVYLSLASKATIRQVSQAWFAFNFPALYWEENIQSHHAWAGIELIPLIQICLYMNCTLVQFTQFCPTMPPPPHHAGPACVPVTLVPPESGFAAPGLFPHPWSDRRAPRSSSYCDVALCEQNLLKSMQLCLYILHLWRGQHLPGL